MHDINNPTWLSKSYGDRMQFLQDFMFSESHQSVWARVAVRDAVEYFISGRVFQNDASKIVLADKIIDAWIGFRDGLIVKGR